MEWWCSRFAAGGMSGAEDGGKKTRWKNKGSASRVRGRDSDAEVGGGSQRNRRGLERRGVRPPGLLPLEPLPFQLVAALWRHRAGCGGGVVHFAPLPLALMHS